MLGVANCVHTATLNFSGVVLDKLIGFFVDNSVLVGIFSSLVVIFSALVRIFSFLFNYLYPYGISKNQKKILKNFYGNSSKSLSLKQIKEDYGSLNIIDSLIEKKILFEHEKRKSYGDNLEFGAVQLTSTGEDIINRKLFFCI